jgi:hypothetical protein
MIIILFQWEFKNKKEPPKLLTPFWVGGAMSSTDRLLPQAQAAKPQPWGGKVAAQIPMTDLKGRGTQTQPTLPQSLR